MEQNINVRDSQNVPIIQAGRDVHIHEAERPKDEERKIKKLGIGPDKKKNKRKSATRDKLLVEAMHRCCLCPQHEDITDVHHIIFISEGGSDTEDNLMVVCPTCHAKIHRRPGMYTSNQLKTYKERWVSLCAKGISLEMLIPSLHNQTPPEPNFVGRVEMLSTITQWYNDPDVHIGALIGWGGFGKSALARKWYNSLECIDHVDACSDACSVMDTALHTTLHTTLHIALHIDGIFWFGFYRNASLDRFLDELLRYLAQGTIDLNEIKTSWQKAERIKEFLGDGEYLIILDGLEEMQKKVGTEIGAMENPEFKEILTYMAEAKNRGLCLITTRLPLPDIEKYPGYKRLDIEELSKENTRALFEKTEVKGTQDEVDAVWEDFKGHTLSLVLLANYLTGLDIKKASQIPPFYSDKEAGGKAHRILLWYDKQLKEEQRQFMKVFSLVRGAIGEKEVEAIFYPLINTQPFHFNQMVSGLCKRRLITKEKDIASGIESIVNS
ncbi:MAG: HNH endonuclease, partial [Candidatus Desantisbacteria bacterium]